MDSNDDFKRPYVFCGVCYKPTGPFYLTSCAHILCHHHHAQQLVPQVCPVCNTTEISTVELNSKALPAELKSYFRAFLPSLESIYAIARFQYEGLTGIVEHQKKLIERLTSKIGQQRDVMKSVREELVKAREYKNQINGMNAELNELRRQNADLFQQLKQMQTNPAMLEPKATSTMKSNLTNINTNNIFKPKPYTSHKALAPQAVTPSLVPKNFASSVQKHISTKATKRFAPPAEISISTRPNLPVPARSNTDFGNASTQPTPFKPIGINHIRTGTSTGAGSGAPSNNPFLRTPLMPRAAGTSRVPTTRVSLTNPHFPMSASSSSGGRKSIPTHPNMQSPFRRLYSSRESNPSEFSWSISKHK
jgi:hypothetical protein